MSVVFNSLDTLCAALDRVEERFPGAQIISSQRNQSSLVLHIKHQRAFATLTFDVKELARGAFTPPLKLVPSPTIEATQSAS